MFELESPKYFYLVERLPIVVALLLFNLFWKRKKQREFGDLDLVRKLSPDKSVFKPFLKFIIIIL